MPITSRFPITRAVGALCLFAFLGWLLLYVMHLRTVPVAAPPGASSEGISAIVDSYDREVHPVLTRKCGACHTDTAARPFFYYIPLVDRFTKPYTEREIFAARQQFDFSDGFDTERTGAAMETVLRLRAVARDNDMPPPLYRWARPHHRLNEAERARFLAWAERAASTLLGTFAAPAHEAPAPLSDREIEALAHGIIAACPRAAPEDVSARDACADALGAVPALSTHVSDPFLWGGQSAEGDYKPYHAHTTRFNPLLWRRYYLSLFMFEGDFHVVHDGELLALRLPARFRSRMPDGEYPYPFWHSASKWRKYNEAAELILLIREGHIIGSFRSAARRDPVPAYEPRKWDGRWWWQARGEPDLQPRVTNFSALFSPRNPHVPALNAAYRNLFLGFRDERCMTCHSPSNSVDMKTLEILSSPGHTLAARNRLVRVLEDNAMPPVTGIEDGGKRDRLSGFAREFRVHADAALVWENEHTRTAALP